jgi:D-alanyl-D-alanine carboxypeptidase/D-alanyl-D-alanine-endopeptidase (penicillin-binding protein 4)
MMKLLCFILLQMNVFTSGINKHIQNFRTAKGQEGIQVSVSIRALNTGEQVYAYSPEINLPPASTLKLVTTATAMEFLGSKYRFETMIYSNGRVSNGKILGDLLLEGIGDPTFGSPRFNADPFSQILATLQENEITAIEGQLRILNNDSTRFPMSWLVGDIGNYYGAFSSPFNFHENLYTVSFTGGAKVGDPAGISAIYPYDSRWKIKNQVKTGPLGSGDQVNILNLPFSNDILMVGTVPQNAKEFKVKGAIPNVNAIFTDSLKNHLAKHGIPVNGKLFPENLQNEELGSVLSPEILEIAKETNFRSINIFADGLANFIWEHEAENFDAFVKNFWLEKGVDMSAHRFLDGSGLSPLNTLSTQTLSQVLVKMKNNTDFLKTLPVAGKEGTVSTVAQNTGGKISMKSGSISGCRNYAGYFTSNIGKRYAFSIFVNGYHGEHSKSVRTFLDEFFTKMVAIKE